MQISTSLPIHQPVAAASAPVSSGQTAMPARRDPVEPASRPVNFSHISPRQLLAYVNDMISKDQIDPDDATSMVGSIPGAWYTERPDTPLDFASNIKAIADFDRNNGYAPLAAWYDGLSDRMKIMEARSSPVSVRA